ncbi:MAG TPA: HD domain-containing protein, partial [Campylobacterales bacterium]|nr:HD domain-containing protein [Campylobacterales bacterium]
SYSATVESISLVVSMRDGETGEHIRRTKSYVKALAQYLYDNNFYRDVLNQNFILYLYEAAPLHDIGKIGIPDAILKKEGNLTPDEYKIMQKHPELAKAVIEKAMKFYDKNIFLDMAYNIAYYHHERWDGQGYPLGLEKDNIPLEAQLMALADIYDSLISKRCYKEAYAYDEVEKIIIEGRGAAFNPILVDAFIEIKDEFREIHKRYKDEKI